MSLFRNARRQLLTRWRFAFAGALALVTMLALANLTAQPVAVAAISEIPPPTSPAEHLVPVDKSRIAKHVAPPKPYKRFDPSGNAALPVASDVTVPLTASGSGKARAGTTPISLTRAKSGTTPAQVRVKTADQQTALAAGVHGVVFSVQSSGAAGTVGVDVDDTTFRNAFGGDFAARLRLVRLPGCVLSTPAEPKCQRRTPVRTAVGTPLATQIAVTAGAPVVLAVESSTDGSSGNYTATSLSPGGTWAAGGNTGAFTYSYDVHVPAAIAGVAPAMTLSYNSASQDARTEGSNDQSSWLGDGWSSTENFIERTYQACSDVSGSGAPDGSGDLCWAGQILTLSLNGSSTPIVYDSTSGTFRPADDQSTIKIEDLTGASNGTDNGEYFKVTESGTEYYFGRNHLPGWASGKEETKSAWSAPVYNAHDGVSACPDGAFAATACTLGYRFNLDYVVDTHNNAMAYYYKPETGYYGADMNNTAVAYTRGGTLARIDYGMTNSTIYSTAAPEQVVFSADTERCFAGLPAGNTCADSQMTSHPEYWPDTPVDLNCTSGSSCTMHGVSFWSRKRLTSITTQVLVSGAFKPVDRYDFAQSFPDGGDHASKLWLDSITHTGLDRLGGATEDKPSGTVSFGTPLQLPNRVGTLPGLQRMYHNRIQTIFSETGAETTVDYATPDCSSVPSSDPDDPADTDVKAFASTNTTACFPVYWTPEGQPAPLVDWFYTHPVKSVTTEDPHNHQLDGTQPRLVTEFTYRGKPGWHYDDNELTKAKYRTWGQFRGYPEVDTTTGDPSVMHLTNGQEVHDQKTLTKTYYFLGMGGDTMPGGGTRDVPPVTSQDGDVSVTDDDALAGQIFETDTYTGATASDTINSATVSVPKIIGPTLTRSRSGLPALKAQMVRTAKTLTRTKVSYGWRKTETDTFYNTTLGQSTTGMVVQTDDRGEVGAAGNVATCTLTRYLDGSKDTQVLTAEVITTTQDCTAVNPTPAGTLTSDTRTSFDLHAFAYNDDGQTNPAKPTAGDITKVENASVATTSATTPTFVTSATSTFDSYGRALTATRTPNSKAPDGSSLAQTVYSRFTPATGGLPTQATSIVQVTAGSDCSAATVSSLNCQVSTATLDAARQLPIAKTGVDGLLTSLTFDALGRLTAVWLPNKSKADSAPANLTYEYALSATGPSVVTTNTLLDPANATDTTPHYSHSETLYDAMLRPLETQKSGENDTTLISDVEYDTHGWPVTTNNAYSIAGDPSKVLIADKTSFPAIPDSTVIDHDAMGRITESTEEHNRARTWSTHSAYTGDATTILPPTGAVPTRTTVDARGQQSKLEQFKTPPTFAGDRLHGFTASGGTTQSIAYEYTPTGKQNKATGPDGTVWQAGFDLLGRQTSTTDPDAGASTATYDDAGNLVATKDSRLKELDYTYDLLGRKLTAFDKANNFKYASWTYDTLRAGQPTSSSRYVKNVTGSYTVASIGYTDLNHSSGTQITLPTAEKPLPTTYLTRYSYSPNDELLTGQEDAATPAMIGESLTYAHDKLGAPTTTSGIGTYVGLTSYTPAGLVSGLTMGASNSTVNVVYSYDEQTLRMTGRTVSRQAAPGPLVDDTTYTYDDAGNPLSITDKQSETGNIVTDTQCFQYGALNRLAQAWAAKAACPAPGTDPTAATVASGAGSYWQTYTYNDIGNRTNVVDHSTTGGADTSTAYSYGTTTGAQPHTLTAVTGATPTSFGYDTRGDLFTRTTTGATTSGQKLTWDNEGHLTQVDTTGATATTKYLYDADGNQLIRRDPGRTTLFAGDTQIVVDTSVTPNVILGALRTYYYGGTGPAVATRSTLPGGSDAYLVNDPHGTATIAIDQTTQQLSRQQYKPYGEPRTTANPFTWPDPTHSFLGQPQDTSTGYTDLGARKYDPALGRFISLDPVLETTDPNQLGGYTYAGDNPISGSDPSGLVCMMEDGTSCGPPQTGKGGGGNNKPTGNDPLPKGTAAVRTGDNGIEYVCISGFYCMDHYQVRDFGQFIDQYNAELARIRAIGGNAPEDVIILQAMAGGCYNGNDAGAYLCDPITKTDLDNASGLASTSARDDPNKLAHNIENFAATTLVTFAGLLPTCLLRGALSGGGRKQSFGGDTPILMADGTTKKIEDVKVGDVVMATDPETGEQGPRRVTAIWPHQDDLYTLTVNGKTIITTEDHPYWDVTDREWERADKLDIGDELLTPDGQTATVDGFTTASHRYTDAYNLTVDELHTYYVLAGNTPVLVHNTGPLCGVHGGASGSPAGLGLVEGSAPAKAFDMLDKVKNRTGGIGKVPGYEGNGSWGNKANQLPGGAYREWDVNATADLPTCSVCGRPIRGGERLLTPKSGSGGVYYTPDHYGTFYYVGEYP